MLVDDTATKKQSIAKPVRPVRYTLLIFTSCLEVCFIAGSRPIIALKRLSRS